MRYSWPRDQTCVSCNSRRILYHLATREAPWYLAYLGPTYNILGLPGCSDSKEFACSVGDLGSIPGWGRSPGEGNSNPLQNSCLEIPMDGGAWQVIVYGVLRVRHDWATSLSLFFTISFLFSHLYLPTKISWCSCLTRFYKYNTLDNPASLINAQLCLTNIISATNEQHNFEIYTNMDIIWSIKYSLYKVEQISKWNSKMLPLRQIL